MSKLCTPFSLLRIRDGGPQSWGINFARIDQGRVRETCYWHLVPRGENAFVEIEWDEALALATDWLGAIRKTDPKKLAFFTGRDQSQSLTGWWAAQFGTPNFAAHGGFLLYRKDLG